jgi:hypothetical protein
MFQPDMVSRDLIWPVGICVPNVECTAEDDTESVDADNKRPVSVEVNVDDNFTWYPERQD